MMSSRIAFNEATKSYKNKIKKKIRERLCLVQTECLMPHGLKFRRIEIECYENRTTTLKFLTKKEILRV